MAALQGLPGVPSSGNLLKQEKHFLSRASWFPLDHLLRWTIRVGRFEIVDTRGVRHVYAGAPGPDVAIRLHDPTLHAKMAFEPSVSVGEAYTSGDLTIERGTLYDLIDLYGRNVANCENHPVQRIRRFLEARTTRHREGTRIRNARHDVAVHYDTPEGFFELFLDPDLQYSCAYFTSERDGLYAAQCNKKDHIAAKLLLEPGLEVLDIGSGWGGLSIDLAARFGVRVVGITLSREQLEVSRRRAREAGLSDRVRFELCDYREVKGTYDGIVSVGMFEHVGSANYETFFDRVRELLRDDGVALLHSIGRMEAPCMLDPWMRKHIFPGAHIPALSEVLDVVERSSLWCTDLEVLRLHYAETLRHWRSRFAAKRAEAVRRYGEPRCRKWEFYLTGAEVAFRQMRQMVFQMQLTRNIGAVPITRDYMLDAERAARKASEPSVLTIPATSARSPSSSAASG